MKLNKVCGHFDTQNNPIDSLDLTLYLGWSGQLIISWSVIFEKRYLFRDTKYNHEHELKFVENL